MGPEDAHSLEVSYRRMSVSDLMDIARKYDSLTETAQAALRAEFERRSLDPPLVEETSSAEAEDGEPPAKLVTVRRYRDLSEAFVARAVLEGEGILCFLQDENFVRLDWGYSNFIGGLRLQVPAKDAQFADELLAQRSPAVIDVPGEPPFVQPICPTCASNDIVAYDPGLKLAATSLLLLGLPTRISSRKSSEAQWHCMHCGTLWADDEQP